MLLYKCTSGLVRIIKYTDVYVTKLSSVLAASVFIFRSDINF
jgi:hypothetical protein